MADPLLEIVENLSRYHREHEKHYSFDGLEEALRLQRASRTLKALAERWQVVAPAESPAPSPYAGAEDLNDERAIEESGVLFMEGQGEPTEIAEMKAELKSKAATSMEGGEWLANAMQASWGVAEALLGYPELADLLGERHRIIANNWQTASLFQLHSHLLERSVTILGKVDFSPAALREDLAGERRAPAYLFSAAELLDRAADISSEAAVLIHQNERRWRIFNDRVKQLTPRG
ncbi:MAG TPA: hypothetical protein VFI17_10315 [Solirubrobacterales bacterium]|nr:hypothetical protein [Solirubrobacterales bacterium]